MSDQNIVDKTMRSVFVGNIPYEVSEEKLKDIFSEVGPVISFKLVFDRDSGKPKGYGFCEYKDQETALSAMRNLNNYEIAGRNLRVDNACTEKSRLEMQSLMQSAQVESTYGESVSPEKAPEVISKAVASLPPEQIYELMKQMKQCIQNNPTESRQLLLENPQLTYALLQIMTVMKVIDSTIALSMLHPANTVPPTLTLSTTGAATTVNNINSTSANTNPILVSDAKSSFWNSTNSTRATLNTTPSIVVPPPSTIGSMQPPPLPPMVGGQDMDMRTSELSMQNRFADQDLRIPPMPAFPQPEIFKRDPRLQQQMSDGVDHRQPFPGLVPPPGMIPPPNMGLPMPLNMPPMSAAGMPVLPNMPRMVPPPGAMAHPIRTSQSTNIATASASAAAAAAAAVTSSGTAKPSALAGAGGSDSEKAALIMQVLQLTDEQIAMLPAEQRQSILALKEQIAKSAKR